MATKVPLGPGTVPASGEATLQTGPQTGRVWQVTQIAVQCSGTSNSTATVSANDHLVCATASGNQDTAAGYPPIVIRDAEQIIISWSNATPNSTVSAWLYYDDVTALGVS